MAAFDPSAAVAKLRGTARELVALLATAKPEELHRRVGDEWSPATVVSHLADAELVYGYRIRIMLTGDRPYLAAYDEQAWARRFAELDPDVKDTLSRWRVLRDANVRLLASLDEAEWKLPGVHAERGEQTIATIAETLVAHDRDHLAQIRTGLAAP